MVQGSKIGKMPFYQAVKIPWRCLLFKQMYNLAGIRCDIINGYTRNKHYQIKKKGNTGF